MKRDLPPVNYDLIRLGGGLDQVTPTLSLKPGVVRRAANFECSINGGYTRIAGYERYDGRPNPSDAQYNVLLCSITGVVAVGNTVTGTTSSATGKVIAITDDKIIITRQTGVFVAAELLQVGASFVASIIEVQGADAEGLADVTYKSLAADEYRSSIAVVPGSGPIRGVAYFNGYVYAWRNSADGLSLGMYVSSGAGWTAVALGFELPFNTGTAEISAAATVTGATSGATGVVSRVVLQDGTVGAGTAEGRLMLSATTGTFVAGENLQVGGVTKAIAGGAATAITLAPGGRVEVAVGNIGGGPQNFRMYGADGVNRGFEFGSGVYVPIVTGMTVDTPNHVVVHKQHLFFSFGSSLQFSSIGLPYQWTPLLGAAELAMNAPVTNLIALPGDQSSGALGVFTRNDTSILYGSSEADFKLSNFNTGTGAIAYTSQNMDNVYVLDDRGVMNLATTLNFGNFAAAALTLNIRPFIQFRRNLATGSSVDREKGQYRVFFSDGTGVYITIANGKVLGAMPVQFPNAVTCCVEGETPDGSATQFFGSTNGYIYRLDAGTSFDGTAISANINLVFNSINSPRILKRYRKASVEMTGSAYSEIQFGYDLGYRSEFVPQAVDAAYDSDLRSSYWDEMTWDNFVWDGKDISPTEVEVTGTAENIGIRITSTSALFQPFTVNSVIVHYTMRRGLR